MMSIRPILVEKNGNFPYNVQINGSARPHRSSCLCGNGGESERKGYTIMKKLLLTALLVLALAVLPVAAGADEVSVDYLDENGVKQTADNVSKNIYPSGSEIVWNQRWYVAKNDSSNPIDPIDITDVRIQVSGDVHLILADGVTLIAEKGISVPVGSSLTIYAQSTGSSMGSLQAYGSDLGDAGIGGKSGKNDSSDSGAIGESCGTVTINGGRIEAYGGNGGAGIGGGRSYYNVNSQGSDKGGNGGIVTINGGIVTAEGKNGAPAIGGGYGTSGNGASGFLYFKPASGKGIFATNLSDNTQIGGFARSNEDKSKLFKEVSYARFELYNKAAVDEVQEKISKLPDPGSYTPGNSADDERILEAKKALDSLTDADQRFVSDEHKNRLNALLTKLSVYTILDGDGQTVVVGTAVTLTFRASGPLSLFSDIMINDKSVRRDSYTAQSGSTVVTLNPGYVASLPVGEYALSIRYTDGSAVAHFRVIPAPAEPNAPAAPNLPQTGDSSGLLLWTALAALCALGAAALWAGKCPRRGRRGS